MARVRFQNGVTASVDDAKVARLGLGWESVEGSPSTDSTAEGYDAMTVDQLKDEIRTRNTDRDDDTRLGLTGTKAELIASLEADDS